MTRHPRHCGRLKKASQASQASQANVYCMWCIFRAQVEALLAPRCTQLQCNQTECAAPLATPSPQPPVGSLGDHRRTPSPKLPTIVALAVAVPVGTVGIVGAVVIAVQRASHRRRRVQAHTVYVKSPGGCPCSQLCPTNALVTGTHARTCTHIAAKVQAWHTT